MQNKLKLTILKKNEIKAFFIKLLMINGKKNTAFNMLDDILFNIKNINKTIDPYFILYTALLKVEPLFDIRTIKIVKSNINVPIPLNNKRRTKNAIKLILEAANTKSKNINNSTSKLIALEIYNSFQGSSNSIQKRNDIHKKAFENRSFAHYRWFN